MGSTVSYTPEELAKILKISRFTVYEMIKRGELNAYRIGRKMRVDAPDLENYINKIKMHPVVLQALEVNCEEIFYTRNPLVISGQDDMLEILTRYMGKKLPSIRFLRSCYGCMDGLAELYRGTVNVATAHLWDGETDTYNIPYVRRMMPSHRVLIIGLAEQTAGFYVAPGNPKAIQDWSDLIKDGVRFINRELGCGIRVLLDEKLRVLNIDRRDVDGYEQEVLNHMAVASCIIRGYGDVGVGTEKVAMQVKDIDFIPLQKERYDLIIRREDTDKPLFLALLSVLQSESFRSEVSCLGGYDLEHTGEILAEM